MPKPRHEDILEWDPGKIEEAPRIPSPFEKYLNREVDGFQIVEPDVPSVTGEQRRQALESMLPRLLEKAGMPGSELLGRICYVPNPITRSEVSIVRFRMRIPGLEDQDFRFNVPPFGEWHRQVMIVVLDFLWAWAHERKLA